VGKSLSLLSGSVEERKEKKCLMNWAEVFLTYVLLFQMELWFSSQAMHISEKLVSKKPVFMESKENKGGEDVLVGYARAIENKQGGLLLSVVGGKMSEGINFSDGLGRCVVIVGLPFPNIMSGEWQSKLKYIESSMEERLEIEGLEQRHRKELAKSAGREFYENACMRAVNQSIGRAIRHKGDYAAIVMIDRRFGTQKIKDKLPGWIREGLVSGAEDKSFSQLMGGLGIFFRSKNNT
jgi:chromosome transmission fidelity protein 1